MSTISRYSIVLNSIANTNKEGQGRRNFVLVEWALLKIFKNRENKCLLFVGPNFGGAVALIAPPQAPSLAIRNKPNYHNA